MTPDLEDRLAAKVPETLALLLGIAHSDARIQRIRPTDTMYLLPLANREFLVDFRKSTSSAAIAAAARRLREQATRRSSEVVPVLAVPFMGDVGRQVCQATGVNWIDLGGNAFIAAPGLRVMVEGKPNLFRKRGRPANLFAPKSSRLTRWLLMHPEESFTQRQIARATGMTEGFVSRIASGLEKQGYVVRDEAGIRAKDASLMLDAWRESYRFSQHTVHQGHVAARSGDALARTVSDALGEQRIDHAATGLAAAWMYTRFAAFRIATIYLPADPSPALFDRLGYRPDPRGANLWLVVPNDAGVFHGATEKDGVPCVHPVQAYLDLKDQPERASEAAEHLRAQMLNWRSVDQQAKTRG
jgi:hypothetical protein